MTLHEKIAQARLLAERASVGPWHWKCSYGFHKHEDKGLDTNCENIEAGRMTLEPNVLSEWNEYADDAGISVSRRDAEFISESRTLLPALAEALAIAVKTMKEERANLERIQREIDQCKKHYKMHFYPTIGTFRLAEIDQALAEIRKALEVSE